MKKDRKRESTQLKPKNEEDMIIGPDCPACGSNEVVGLPGEYRCKKCGLKVD